MTLRDKTATSDLLHGRWSDKTGYCYIRLNGEGYEGERNRIHQPVDVMEHTADGLWLPKAPTSDEECDELRCYPTGLGDMRDIILDHQGGVGSTIYRIGVKKRVYKDRQGNKKDGWQLAITDRIDLAQKSLPPTSSVQTHAPEGPPTGGSSTVTIPDGMHTAPTTTSVGPISPPSPGGNIPPPGGEKVVESKETGLCGCGRDAVAFTFNKGVHAGETWCTNCGRRVA